jgi:hypothetical protein
VVNNCAQGCWAVPHKSSGTVHYRTLVSGMWALVGRHPCLTQHNAQPMIVVVQDVDSVQFPVLCCAQYNTNYDGDEVHLYPLMATSVSK